MNKAWRVAIAEYNHEMNAVAEKRVASFDGYEECMEYVNAHGHEAIMGYHKDCMDLDNPAMAYVKTDAYHDEYSKVRGE